MDRNVEAVQFLLKYLHVNVDAQANRPIIKAIFKLADPYKKEVILSKQLTEFHTSFVLLIKDFEFEFNNILKSKGKIVEHLSKSTKLPQSLKPILRSYLRTSKPKKLFLTVTS